MTAGDGDTDLDQVRQAAKDRPIGGMARSGWMQRVAPRTPESLKQAGRSAFRVYGQATSRVRDLPDYLVIGAKKGGTTSVVNWLVEHPQVMPLFPRMQRHKSPHYFDINFDRGLSWYLSHFPSKPARRVHERRFGAARTGEASPYYLFHPAAPERIHDQVPQARLVAILREPVSRAYSNFWDRVATGNETLPTFEDALDAEEQRLARATDDWLRVPGHYDFDHDHHSYLARGRYAEQLERYFAHFPREQLLVLPLDALHRDPEGSFRRVEDHLGLDHHAVDLTARNARENKPPLLPETKDRLRDYYRTHNERLQNLLGEDWGW
ncbi:sulfotransferase [Nocardioides sp.]|uniref:sulfotransferase n=1 Tax=Nocardioides sp. TaxID=35761 RepID=UPI00352893CA